MKINRILLSIALVAAGSFAACKKEPEPDAGEVTPMVSENEIPATSGQSDLTTSGQSDLTTAAAEGR